MKGFFSWFNSRTKIKRWMLLILVGICLTCFALASILEYKVLRPKVVFLSAAFGEVWHVNDISDISIV